MILDIGNKIGIVVPKNCEILYQLNVETEEWVHIAL